MMNNVIYSKKTYIKNSLASSKTTLVKSLRLLMVNLENHKQKKQVNAINKTNMRPNNGKAKQSRTKLNIREAMKLDIFPVDKKGMSHKH